MATLTIRNVDDEVKARIREQAARNGVSMEEELRRLLQKSFGPRPKKSLGEHMRAKMKELGIDGVELELPSREDQPKRPDVDFSQHIEEWELVEKRVDNNDIS